MRGAAARLHETGQPLALEEPQAIERRDADVARRMVLKDQERSGIRGRDLLADPSHPGQAQLTVLFAVGSQRVEVQELSVVEVVGALEKSVDVLDLREGCQQGIAIIVIADQDASRRRHLLQLRPQETVGARIPQLDEVAGDDDALRIRVKRFDLFEAGPQARQGIDALRPIPAWLECITCVFRRLDDEPDRVPKFNQLVLVRQAGVNRDVRARRSLEAPASSLDQAYDAGLVPSTVTLLSATPEARNAAISSALMWPASASSDSGIGLASATRTSSNPVVSSRAR